VVKRRNSIDGQFAAHTIEMIRSPAWSVLSLSARRVLDRIEIEHADHGGNDNGRLPVTYDDFERYGIHRHQIRKALREIEALGFAEITERGRAGNAEFRSPHKFRLTYFHVGRAPPTNEWQRIKTVEDAQALAKAARQEAPQKTKVQWRKTPNLSGGKPTPKTPIPWCGNHHYWVQCGFHQLLLYLGEGRHRRPTGAALPLRRCRNIFLGWHPSWRGAWRRKPASTYVG
jgi:hypothetical protein